MVYASYNNRPIIAKNPIKKRRVRGEHSKAIESLMRENYVSVKINDDGEPAVVLISRGLNGAELVVNKNLTFNLRT